MGVVSEVEQVAAALKRGADVRPRVGGFPYLGESLRLAGVLRSHHVMPSRTTVFVTGRGRVVAQGEALIEGMVQVPAWDETALVDAIRADQAGTTEFSQFLAGCWDAGVAHFDVDYVARTCVYSGATGDEYVESYPAVDLPSAGGS